MYICQRITDNYFNGFAICGNTAVVMIMADINNDGSNECPLCAECLVIIGEKTYDISQDFREDDGGFEYQDDESGYNDNDEF